jgi:hypothetical protein
MKVPPQSGYLFLGFKQGLGCKGSQSADNPWPNDLQLLAEEGLAGSDLFPLGISIGGRPAFNDVGNIDLFPGEADGVDDAS